MTKDKASRRKFIHQTGTLAGGAFAIGLTPATAAAAGQAPSNAAPQLSKPQKLRALLGKPGLLQAPEGYTVIAAKLAEAHGFEAIYIGGNMMSGTYLGLPDWGLITNTEMVDIAGRIAREVSIPAIVDADQGGETAINVYRTVQHYEKAGLAALHIEDSLLPKLPLAERQRLLPGNPSPLQTLDRMLVRVQAALDARSDPNFVIIARTDATDIDEIIRRGKAFAKAGADILMNGFGGMKPEQIDRIANEVGIPLLGINVRLANHRGSKLKVNIHANMVSGPATMLCDTILRELKELGEPASRPALTEEVVGRLKNEVKLAELSRKWVVNP